MSYTITLDFLKKHNACIDGIECFVENFPEEKATLAEVTKICIDKNLDSYGMWIYDLLKNLNIEDDLLNKGYRNSGYRNSGYRNSGYRNSGDYNSGDYNSGNYNSGNYNSGDYNSGNYNSGDRNSGDYNSGNYNSGDRNSGYRNSGDCNSGDYNSGDYNSGDCNSGDCNSGDYNSGDYNSGDYNSGYRNSGDYNSGDYNSGDYNSGYFNTNSPKIRLFNMDTDLGYNDAIILKLNKIISSNWRERYNYVYLSDMTDLEKKENPNSVVTGGFLRIDTKYTYKDKWIDCWKRMNESDKLFICSLPNFNKNIFFKITGVNVDKD